MIDVPKTRRWFKQVGIEDKTYRAYPGAGHTLDFEPDRAQYLADLARVAVGAGRIGAVWFWVLRDPWGNEFCVLHPNFPELLARRRPWSHSYFPMKNSAAE
jgi:hypothetical protein